MRSLDCTRGRAFIEEETSMRLIVAFMFIGIALGFVGCSTGKFTQPTFDPIDGPPLLRERGKPPRSH